jgi:hypothetical protein
MSWPQAAEYNMIKTKQKNKPLLLMRTSAERFTLANQLPVACSMLWAS